MTEETATPIVETPAPSVDEHIGIEATAPVEAVLPEVVPVSETTFPQHWLSHLEDKAVALWGHLETEVKQLLAWVASEVNPPPAA